MRSATVRICWCLVGAAAVSGCLADLKIVHTPDLWTLTAKEERKARPGPLPTSPPQEAFGIRRIYASLQPAEALCDGNPGSIAVAPDPACKDQYILVDLGCVRTISQVRMLHADPNGFPCKYRVDVAGDHNYPYTLALVDNGSAGETVGVFRKPVECRFLRITLLALGTAPWNVAELSVH